MQDRHKEITADENDIKQLQLHTHTRCKQSQHASSGLMIRGWLAWGSRNTPRKSAKRSRKDLPETVLSRRGLFTGKGKMVISECENIMKMISTEQARRNEDVGFGFTSFGVVGKKI